MGVVIGLVPSKAYKVYSALLNQTDPNPVSAVVLENDIGNIVWTDGSDGVYTATLAGAFPQNKTASFCQDLSDIDGKRFTGFWGSNNTVVFTASDIAGVQLTGQLNYQFVEIRVYQ
jgi:hypothetical protein